MIRCVPLLQHIQCEDAMIHSEKCENHNGIAHVATWILWAECVLLWIGYKFPWSIGEDRSSLQTILLHFKKFGLAGGTLHSGIVLRAYFIFVVSHAARFQLQTDVKLEMSQAVFYRPRGYPNVGWSGWAPGGGGFACV